MRRAYFIGLVLCAMSFTITADEGPLLSSAPVHFNRDIRPIFSNNCYACHGPDKNERKSDLRLDTEEGAFAEIDGHRVVIPGKPEESELYLRITDETESGRMPPTKFGKQLTKKQKELIRRWIEQGAKWEKHWSLIPPQRPELPTVKSSAWPLNPIDHFILARLEQEGIKPSPDADRRTLIRRLSFDLIGLPPTAEEVEAFEADASADAYEKVVDRLLASPHFGERLAIYWLDLVRFADTVGYHSDTPRNIAPYRDYVINAFNQNKRFDQFTIEQLAGDLLPNATIDQKVASGYNRLLQTTEEGGAQPKEYIAKYASDRVRNFSSVWLSSTMGCAECHDHKFDPTTTKDFYSLAAFFADVKELPVGRREVGMAIPTEKQSAELKQLEKLIAEAKKELDKPSLESLAASALTPMMAAWLEPAFVSLAKNVHHRAEIEKQIPRSLVAATAPPTMMRVLPRGNWMDESGPTVMAATPHFLSALDVKDRPAHRLDLARWLFVKDHPLTARVFVNRLWKLYFGQGISKSLEDFGAQGEWPTHPELLDWLAVEFVESGWNVKHVIKRLVMARTYRQRSEVNKQLREKDPDNRLVARQSRFRLDAEFVRDNALAVSELLIRKVGGSSVKPYQPAGYWDFLNFPLRKYEHDHGERQYRRGLYTHWQRTFLHPSMVAFDASSREECCAERPRSNIPQQALVLLNDPTYVEASRVFAQRILAKAGSADKDRLDYAYRHALSRTPTAEETAVLTELLVKHRKHFQENAKAADELVRTGEAPLPKDINAVELAAWTSIARTIFNLHEMITRN